MSAQTAASSQFDRDAAWGNERLARAEYIRERQRQDGCLASEAARRWDAGRRCGSCGGWIPQGDGSCLCFDNGCQ